MTVKVHIKSKDDAVKIQRESAAQRVLSYFGSKLPSSRLLCFLDDEDSALVSGERGAANRGLYGPIHDNTPMPEWPEYVTNQIFVDDGKHFWFQRVIDDLIYLHGSTCANEVGLTMTLAHELQHAIQHAQTRKVWAVNGLVPNLDRGIVLALKLTWADIPTERDARIVSKRASAHLFGEQRVDRYIEEKIAEHVTESDADDWRFIRTLTPSSSVDLNAETKRLFARLKVHRSELEGVLKERKEANNPDFIDVDLNDFF